MIPQAAVKRFLGRELDTHLWVKGLERSELLKEIEQMHPRPELPEETWLHQLACFILGVAFPRFSFWLDMGTGKTLLAVLLLAYWHRCGKLRRAIVFAISDKAFSAWEKPFKRFNIKLPYILLEGSSERKWKQLEEFGDGVVVVSYPGAVAMVHERLPGKRKQKYVIDHKKVKRLLHRVDALVMDESTRAGGRGSLTNKLCDMISRKVKIVYALAGRPFGRDPTLLWSQQRLVDRGETFGETLGIFREAFFTAKSNYWGGPYSMDYTFKKSMKPVLSKMLQHRSITYAADECIELPKQVSVLEKVPFSGEALSYYSRFKEGLIAARGNFREIENAFVRMRQLSSGFLGLKDDETGEKAQIIFEENPKLELLLELLEELPEGRKAIIFYEFTVSGRRIFEELRKRKLGAIWLWAGTKSSTKEIERFMTDASCCFAVLQNRVGAYSLDGLQEVANYEFFYESPVSVIDREQAERRLIRAGQNRKVFVYDLVVEGSMDERILDFHAEGQDLMNALMRDPTSVLGD